MSNKIKWSLDDLDLEKPINPLTDLIDDRDKLLDEIFSIFYKYLPKNLVPSTLKDIPTAELKKLCLNHLQRLERETLLNILSNDTTNAGNEQGQKTGPQSENTLTTNEKSGDTEPCISKNLGTRVTKDAEIQVELMTEFQEKETGDEKDKNDDQEPDDDDLDDILTQAQIEIRELEIRAQAIRELLKRHEEQSEAGQNKAQSDNSKSRKKMRKEKPAENDPSGSKKSLKNEKANIDKIASQSSSKSRKGKSSSSKNIGKVVSMIENDDELEEGEWDEDMISIVSDDDKLNEKKSEADQSKNESQIMMQLDDDDDDSLDRELKGKR